MERQLQFGYLNSFNFVKWLQFKGVLELLKRIQYIK